MNVVGIMPESRSNELLGSRAWIPCARISPDAAVFTNAFDTSASKKAKMMRAATL